MYTKKKARRIKQMEPFHTNTSVSNLPNKMCGKKSFKYLNLKKTKVQKRVKRQLLAFIRSNGAIQPIIWSQRRTICQQLSGFGT